MAKNKGGRATVMTPEVIEKLEEAFLLGCTDVEACLAADIAPATLYNYQEKHPEFLERKEQLKQNPVYKARKTVVNAITKDPRLAMDYLSRKAKKEFGNNVDITTDGKELPTPILGGITKKDEVPTNDSPQ